ncbi:MAG: dihydroneopterin aldolase [Candidatus Dormibacteraeota bacterium]|uniref:7,8-dihydroneopterin aldolase n=1 Tax=Candidatus Dormiibacter inghamiae TaxID=3127013 RepID=A0A934N7M6_9BACT|nr:dihydroneopterin aldolase [Candidatus Dormibacteraeota bacterium]MBJ7606328.1 dihydroneopterin aldolase [Candidatus Dormibacteraeota bacterium]
MDRLLLHGMVFFGRHGNRPAERQLGQRFSVDLELEVDTARAGQSDDLADTVNYSHAYADVKEVVEGEPANLLETVAARIAERVLARPRVHAALVRVRKRPPAQDQFESFGVEIHRKRSVP